jgi:hypothetical protein
LSATDTDGTIVSYTFPFASQWNISLRRVAVTAGQVTPAQAATLTVDPNGTFHQEQRLSPLPLQTIQNGRCKSSNIYHSNR